MTPSSSCNFHPRNGSRINPCALSDLHKGPSQPLPIPRHIEDLTTELSIFNFVLIRLKGLIESRQESHQELLRKWADESKVVFNGCRDTLGKIEALVVKSKIKTKDYSIKGQVTKCVKWQWKKDVLELRVALERYRASINLMLQSLSR